ncbi:hypothetical protein G3O06_48295 [Burkholderia sp. Ac-20345]|nr:hypothetical protein [Burkholderia sp. Ac-20345]MBN3785233.1 hypothetical protein [Burkholderia sp. Ac-20345]
MTSTHAAERAGAGGGGGERQFPVYVFALACAIAALSFFASIARVYRQRA